MADLYKLLIELKESEDIVFIDDEPYFLPEAMDKIIKHYAMEGGLIDEFTFRNSNEATSSKFDYFVHLQGLVWKDVEEELTHDETIAWQDLLYHHQTGRHKEAHESIQEISLREDLACLNPNDYKECL